MEYWVAISRTYVLIVLHPKLELVFNRCLFFLYTKSLKYVLKFSFLQYYTEEGLPRKILEADVCAVCGNHLEIDDTETDYESTYRLSCGHLFHEFCIRGWCVIGKQQTCPYCKEKVDLKRMFKHP